MRGSKINNLPPSPTPYRSLTVLQILTLNIALNKSSSAPLMLEHAPLMLEHAPLMLEHAPLRLEHAPLMLEHVLLTR